MSNLNHKTYVTTYTYLYISIQIIKDKYIKTVPPLHHLSLHLPIPLLRRRRCRWCRFCGWRRSRPAHPRPGRPELYFTKRILKFESKLWKHMQKFVYFLFSSFFCVFFFESKVKENHLVLMQFHVFILAHFMISMCEKISSKENQTTETWRNLHSTFH